MTSVFPADFPLDKRCLGRDQALETCVTAGVPARDHLTTMVDVVQEPEQVIAMSRLREVRQSRVRVGDRTLLLRVIVEASDEEIWVVTMYRTRKYWQR